LVTWLVSYSWLSSQSHKESRESMPARINSVPKLWRLLGLVGLAAIGVIGLRYLTTYPASPPSAGVRSIGGSPAEIAVNRPERHPVEYTLWLGTKVISEPAVLDSEPYLNLDY
jgi:hypothetical protein